MCLRNQIKVAYLDLMRRATPVPGSEEHKELPHAAQRRFVSCLQAKGMPIIVTATPSPGS
jgi:hypothetical protein